MSTAKPRAGRSATSAKKKAAKPRRKRVPGKLNHHVYERYDGKYEVGYRDSTGKLRWPGPFDTIKTARAERDRLLGLMAGGEHVEPSPNLKFGPVALGWMADYGADLAESTTKGWESYYRNHLKKWSNRILDEISPGDVAQLVRDLRKKGLAEWTIAGILGLLRAIFKYARRHRGWRGESPVTLLERRERPKVDQSAERRIYEGDELAEVLAATTEPGGPCSASPTSKPAASRNCSGSGGRTWTSTTSTRQPSPSRTRSAAKASASSSRPKRARRRFRYLVRRR
jgi:hypothetical protein